jgi:hypothetical protein
MHDPSLNQRRTRFGYFLITSGPLRRRGNAKGAEPVRTGLGTELFDSSAPPEAWIYLVVSFAPLKR